MANIMINDLADSVDLDRQAMAGLTGGHGWRHFRRRWKRKLRRQHKRWWRKIHKHGHHRHPRHHCRFGW